MKSARRGALLAAALASGIAPLGHGRLHARGAAEAQATPASRPAALRSLVLMVDGVPWTVMDSLHRAGHFRGFSRPALVLSPFPSLTTVAFRDIWHEAPTPGYEDRYFDIAQNRLAGGAWDVLLGHEMREGFHRHVDLESAALVSSLAYAFPEVLGRVELDELRTGILSRRPADQTLVAYSCTTDAVAHLVGRGALVTMMLRLEETIELLRARDPGVRIDIISDHGNDFVPSHQLPLEEVLARAGFRLGERLERPGDVVVPRFGLVGSVAFYAAAADRSRLVHALAAADGIELAIWQQGDAVEVRGREGTARIEGDEATARIRYLPLTGDPLGFDHVRERLRATGELDAAGFAPDSAWFRESLATPYADALRRLLVAYRGGILNRATVLVSLAPGAHFGDPMGSRFTRMMGTHGSLRTASSSAFFMTTGAAPPAVLRSDQVLDHLPAAVQLRALRLARSGADRPPARPTAPTAGEAQR